MTQNTQPEKLNSTNRTFTYIFSAIREIALFPVNIFLKIAFKLGFVQLNFAFQHRFKSQLETESLLSKTITLIPRCFLLGYEVFMSRFSTSYHKTYEQLDLEIKKIVPTKLDSSKDKVRWLSHPVPSYHCLENPSLALSEFYEILHNCSQLSKDGSCNTIYLGLSSPRYSDSAKKQSLDIDELMYYEKKYLEVCLNLSDSHTNTMVFPKVENQQISLLFGSLNLISDNESSDLKSRNKVGSVDIRAT